MRLLLSRAGHVLFLGKVDVRTRPEVHTCARALDLVHRLVKASSHVWRQDIWVWGGRLGGWRPWGNVRDRCGSLLPEGRCRRLQRGRLDILELLLFLLERALAGSVVQNQPLQRVLMQHGVLSKGGLVSLQETIVQHLSLEASERAPSAPVTPRLLDLLDSCLFILLLVPPVDGLAGESFLFILDTFEFSIFLGLSLVFELIDLGLPSAALLCAI